MDTNEDGNNEKRSTNRCYDCGSTHHCHGDPSVNKKSFLSEERLKKKAKKNDTKDNVGSPFFGTGCGGNGRKGK